MTKIYRSESIISINVPFAGGKKRICFVETSNDCSMYQTDNAAIQKALESSPAFNTWFYLAETIDDKKPVAAAATPVQDKVETVTTIKVSSIAEAKDFLVETFDYTRSSLRSKESILKAAAAHNVTFEGL